MIDEIEWEIEIGGAKGDRETEKGGEKRHRIEEEEEEEEGGTKVDVYPDGRPFEEWDGPQSLVNFAKRTLKPVLLSCAKDDPQFGDDLYLVKV